jgi:hypothetical protein
MEAECDVFRSRVVGEYFAVHPAQNKTAIALSDRQRLGIDNTLIILISIIF